MAGVRARFGIGRCTVLKLVQEGHIRAYRHGSNGWWLYDPKSIAEYLGVEDQDYEKEKKDGETTKIGIYARRSDQDAKGKESLESQVSLLTDYVQKSYGVTSDNIIIYKECVSGVNLSLKTRKAFGRLLADLFDGRLTRLVVKDNSRACRLPGSDELIQFICERNDVDYVRMFSEGDGENDSETAHDLSVLLDYLTSWTNKKSAKKSAFLKKVSLDPKDQDQLLTWWNNGVSILKIIDRCSSHNITGVKHDGSRVAFTPTNKSTLFRLLSRLNRATKGKGNATHSQLQASLMRFAQKHLEVAKGQSERTEFIFNAYKSYCLDNDLPQPSSRRVVTEALVRLGWKQRKVWVPSAKMKYYCLADCQLVP